MASALRVSCNGRFPTHAASAAVVVESLILVNLQRTLSADLRTQAMLCRKHPLQQVTKKVLLPFKTLDVNKLLLVSFVQA